MPLPQDLARQARDGRFWTDAYWLTSADERENEGEALNSCTLRFEVSDRHALVLQFDGEFQYFSLGLSVDGDAPVEIAWDDQAHFHPHVLRWREIDAIGAAIAKTDPTLPHPGVPLLLLMRFAPIADDEDGWLARYLMDRAWDQLGLFSRRERQEFFDRVDARSSGFAWRRLDRGYVVEQHEHAALPPLVLYTLRAENNDEFPLEALEAMLAAVPASTSIAPTTTLPERAIRLSFILNHSSSFPDEAASFTACFLHRALRDAGLGGADLNGTHQTAEGALISSHLSVFMRGDERLARSRVAAILHAGGVLSAARCQEGTLAPVAESRVYVQLCNLELARWAIFGKFGVRFDRPPLTADQRRALTGTLDYLGFEREDEAGIRTLTLPESCRVEAAFPDLLSDENLDGGSLWLERLSAASVEVVSQLMRAASLFVACPLVAPSAKLAATIDHSWPGTHAAPDLLKLLSSR